MPDAHEAFPARPPYDSATAALLERNLQLLHRVQEESGAKVLLALKGFAMSSMAT